MKIKPSDTRYSVVNDDVLFKVWSIACVIDRRDTLYISLKIETRRGTWLYDFNDNVFNGHSNGGNELGREYWSSRRRVERWYDKEHGVAGRWVEKKRKFVFSYSISCYKRNGMVGCFILILYLCGLKCDSFWELFLILFNFVCIVLWLNFFSEFYQGRYNAIITGLRFIKTL